jgi:hypothetical protein
MTLIASEIARSLDSNFDHPRLSPLLRSRDGATRTLALLALSQHPAPFMSERPTNASLHFASLVSRWEGFEINTRSRRTLSRTGDIRQGPRGKPIEPAAIGR